MSRAWLRASLLDWRRKRAYRRTRWLIHRKFGRQTLMAKWAKLVREAEASIALREQQLLPLRQRAYKAATDLVGVMEQGGNNVGRAVERIIRSGGGLPGDPWCGWFIAYCYRLAGSEAVTSSWGAVRLLYPLTGVKRVEHPLRGDLVRFTFDHVGMFVKDNGDATITTIEGNTGASGAVSDSTTGGDGVYRKRRDKSFVNDYLRVTR